MKIEIDISDNQAKLLTGWQIPEELCGPTLEERVHYLIDEQCDYLASRERDAGRQKLHRMFGLRRPDDIDDEIDL